MQDTRWGLMKNTGGMSEKKATLHAPNAMSSSSPMNKASWKATASPRATASFSSALHASRSSNKVGRHPSTALKSHLARRRAASRACMEANLPTRHTQTSSLMKCRPRQDTAAAYPDSSSDECSSAAGSRRNISVGLRAWIPSRNAATRCW